MLVSGVIGGIKWHGNENTNYLIRQYFPMVLIIPDLTEQDNERVILRLNHRPRKCLGFSVPIMVLVVL